MDTEDHRASRIHGFDRWAWLLASTDACYAVMFGEA